MTLESVYYLTGIIFYISWIILVISIIYIAWMAYKAIERAPEQIKEKIMSILPTEKSEIFGLAGMVVTTFIVNKVRNMFGRK